MGARAQARATYAVTRRRLEGYRGAVIAAGVDWSAVPVVAGMTSSVDEGAAAAATLLDLRPSPTALLCVSDRLAEGALAQARRARAGGAGGSVGGGLRRRGHGVGARAHHRAPAASGQGGEGDAGAAGADGGAEWSSRCRCFETELVVRGSTRSATPGLRSAAMSDLTRRRAGRGLAGARPVGRAGDRGDRLGAARGRACGAPVRVGGARRRRRAADGHGRARPAGDLAAAAARPGAARAAGGGRVRAGAGRDDPELLRRAAPDPAGHRRVAGVRRAR